ncbi:MAG: 1,4-alpha-glucan-branching enzyme, partial [Oscillospiraceae bacterium]|nr:1,4-alpha-glucan-branching enzyme [Oscillospiraceae bacterium]
MKHKPKYRILEIDPYLMPFEKDIDLRMQSYGAKRAELLGEAGSIADFANAHHYFGFHRTAEGWVYREWAPAAEAMYLTGDFCNWQDDAYPMQRLENGVFELQLQGADALKAGQKVQAIVVHGGKWLRRIPSYATRVVQDPVTYLWCAEMEDGDDSFPWTDAGFRPKRTPFIYECHIGMAQEKGAVGSYREFIDNVLPRVKKLGYNTIQVMAIMEHPYYGSFGYQVSNFFAASSRYGTARELKELIDTAHKMGIAVLLDVVHSHAVKNVAEGLNNFDGSGGQYFCAGERDSTHPDWDSCLFDYGREEVLQVLLSNLRWWLDEFHFDGFRFDGVTSMLYLHHGLEPFTDLGCYFNTQVNLNAVTYLQLAATLVQQACPGALAIAEDMSGMPGLCRPVDEGGFGFTHR